MQKKRHRFSLFRGSSFALLPRDKTKQKINGNFMVSCKQNVILGGECEEHQINFSLVADCEGGNDGTTQTVIKLFDAFAFFEGRGWEKEKKLFKLSIAEWETRANFFIIKHFPFLRSFSGCAKSETNCEDEWDNRNWKVSKIECEITFWSLVW